MEVFVEITDRDPYTCLLTALGCHYRSTCLRYCFKDKGRLFYLSCSSLEQNVEQRKKKTVEIYFIWLWQAEHLANVQAQGPESCYRGVTVSSSWAKKGWSEGETYLCKIRVQHVELQLCAVCGGN